MKARIRTLWINYRYAGGYPEPVDVRKIADDVAYRLADVLNGASAGVTSKKELLKALHCAARDIQRSGERFYSGSVRRLLFREE